MAGLSMDLLKLGAKPAVKARPRDGDGSTSEGGARMGRIVVTPSAAEAIRAELSKRPTTTEQSGFRVGVQAGGCSGLSYTMAFDDHPRPDDFVIVQDGARVFCDPKSHVYLASVTLDHVRTLMKTGFEFRNPHQKSACGCGDSFTV